MAGFIELLDWFNKRFKTDLNYKTFHGFVVRKYKAKVKVARKSHIKKDVQAVEAFKKTFIRSAKTLSVKKLKATKKQTSIVRMKADLDCLPEMVRD